MIYFYMCDCKLCACLHDVNQVAEMFVIFDVVESILKKRWSNVHEPKGPSLGSIV